MKKNIWNLYKFAIQIKIFLMKYFLYNLPNICSYRLDFFFLCLYPLTAPHLGSEGLFIYLFMYILNSEKIRKGNIPGYSSHGQCEP